MYLKNTNPTTTNSWKKLQKHYKEIKNSHLRKLFNQEPNRKQELTYKTELLNFDFSKNRITKETLNLLLEFANEMDLKSGIEAYFSGKPINETEQRAVLHTALRDFSSENIEVKGKNIIPLIKQTQLKIRDFSEKVISGKWKGFTEKPITDVVNIGIGGSDLGPDMVVESLKYYQNHLKVHFVSNVDGDHVSEIIKKLNPETTLFIVVSKTFTTQETLTNATTLKEWFLKFAQQKDVAKHFVAVSTNLSAATNFGINEENIFPMWSWVGGRFSLWSAVGLSISLAVGYQNFEQLLKGAHATDLHFKNTPLNKNIPVIAGLLSIWYNNFFNCETEAILPYTQYLTKLVPYLQQAIMESNGKSVDRNGNEINYQTGAIIWGSTGTNSQHAFMQLLHQGTKLIPADFIGFEQSLNKNKDHHAKLMANFYAQAEALAFGKTIEEAHLDIKIQGNITELEKILPFKVFTGNKPSNLITAKKLSPKTLGALLSFYEHKILVQGYLWNIYSYDQFGVELGKELANKILKRNS